MDKNSRHCYTLRWQFWHIYGVRGANNFTINSFSIWYHNEFNINVARNLHRTTIHNHLNKYSHLSKHICSIYWLCRRCSVGPKQPYTWHKCEHTSPTDQLSVCYKRCLTDRLSLLSPPGCHWCVPELSVSACKCDSWLKSRVLCARFASAFKHRW